MEWLLGISEGFHFAAQRLPELWFRTGQHLLLTGVSTLLAVAIGLPLGIVASASQSLRPVLLAIIGSVSLWRGKRKEPLLPVQLRER